MRPKIFALATAAAALFCVAPHAARARVQQPEQGKDPGKRPVQEHAQKHGSEHGKEHGKEHGFGVRAFDQFHDILHPLQHEALPAGDFKTIRERSAALVSAGRAVSRLGTPRGVRQTRTYRAHLSKFRSALTRYERAASSGTDEQLRTAYVAVHDTFEELAHLLPRR